MFARRQFHRGLQLLGTAAILLIVVFAEVPGFSKLSNVLQNSGHAPAFGAICLLLVGLFPANSMGLWRRLSYAFVITVCLGIATELAQAVLHRDAEVEDVIHDAIGALGALGFYTAYAQARHQASRTSRITALLGVAIGTVCVVIASAPLVICLAAYWHRGAEFPVIAQFHSPLDMYFVQPTDPEATIVNGALHVSLNEGEWPGVELSEPSPDWSHYQELWVDVSNPGDTALPLGIRVNDRRHNFSYDDRFTESFTIAPRTRLTMHYSLDDIARAPRGRRMDLSNIATIIIFRNGAVAGQSLLLHRIWLQ